MSEDLSAIIEGLPEVGLECRDEGNHAWIKPYQEGREVKEDAYWFRRYRCARDCGCERTRRYDRQWRFLAHHTHIDYPPGYVQKGGVDMEAIELARARKHNPRARIPKARRHLHSA